MLLDGFNGVCGATRKITTRGGQQLSEADLIAPHGEYQYRTHRHLLRLHALRCKSDDGRNDRVELLPERGGRCLVSRRPRPDDDAHRLNRGGGAERRQQPKSDVLAKLPLEPVPPHCRLAMLGNDESDPTRPRLGREQTRLETVEAKTLAVARQGLQLGAARQAIASPEPATPAAIRGFRCRRTWMAAAPSGACAPSCGVG